MKKYIILIAMMFASCTTMFAQSVKWGDNEFTGEKWQEVVFQAGVTSVSIPYTAETEGLSIKTEGREFMGVTIDVNYNLYGENELDWLNGTKLVFTAKDNITGIVIDGQFVEYASADKGEYTNGMWTGLLQPGETLSLTANDGINVHSIVVLYNGAELNDKDPEQSELSQGTSGTCDWMINDEGMLTIRPTNGTSGVLDSWGNGEAPWYGQRESIAAAKVEFGVDAASCKHLFDGCSSLQEVWWEPNVIPADAIGTGTAVNMIVYAPEDTKSELDYNVVIGGKCEYLRLTEGEPLSISQEFEAEYAILTRTFSKPTLVEQSAGWESIVVPFDVTSIIDEQDRPLAPFGSDKSGTHPFWLAQMTPGGNFTYCTEMKANTPYLISMPNSPLYIDEFNITGEVQFIGENITVKKTDDAQPVEGASMQIVPTYIETTNNAAETEEPFKLTSVSNIGIDGNIVGAEASKFGVSKTFVVKYNKPLTKGNANITLSMPESDKAFGNATVSITGTGATISFNAVGGNVFATPGTYVLSIPEGTFLDAEGTPNAAMTLKWIIIGKEAPTLKAGKYYIMENESGLFLSNGANWGTRSVLFDNGICYNVELDNDGMYTLKSGIKNENNALRPSDGFNDQSGTWEIIPTLGGYYIFNGTMYFTRVKDDTRPGFTENKAEASVWSFLTDADRKAALAEASNENPIDATVYIKGADFHYADVANASWSMTKIGGTSDRNSMLVNSHNCEQWNAGEFNINQLITDLPNGIYRVSCQGFTRKNGANAESANSYESGEVMPAYLFANNEKVALKSIFAEAETEAEADMSGFATVNATSGNVYVIANGQNSAAIKFSEGAYVNELMVEVTNGTLNLGVMSEGGIEWVVFDTFRLTYFGEAPVKAGAPAFAEANSENNSPNSHSLVSTRKAKGNFIPGGLYALNREAFTDDELNERPAGSVFVSDNTSVALPFEFYVMPKSAPVKGQYIPINIDNAADQLQRLYADTYGTLRIHSENHGLVIQATKPQTIGIYNAQGMHVCTLRLHPGENRTPQLPAGLYVVGKEKYMVK